MAAWGPVVKKVGGWAVKNAPTWLPTAKSTASAASQRMANRQKAISQATQIDGEFAEVWIRDKRHWVVRKDGEIVNSFPRCDDEAELTQASQRVRAEAWKSPEALTTRRAKAKLRPRRGGSPER